MEIQGYPNYLIYPDGRVYSKKSNKFMKLQVDPKGYLGFLVSPERKRLRHHRLLAIHYIPNPENKPQVDHINRNKQDNRLENLRWVDGSENQLNKGIMKNNKSGHKHICRRNKYWRFHIPKFKIDKQFKTKTDALCYKFIFNLKKLK